MSTRISSQSSSISMSSSTSGRTSTSANVVWRRFCAVERADADEPVHAALGAQPAVGPAAVDGDGHALEAGLLAFLLVEDLGREAMALGPAQVHPQEHLGPVGRLGPAGAGADRSGGRCGRRTRPRTAAPCARDGSRSRGPRRRGRARLRGRRRGPRRAGRRRPGGRRLGVSSSRHSVDLLAQAVRLAQDLLGGPAVVPEAGRLGQGLEFVDASLFGLEVKDAPRSTGSVRPGPGWRRGPPSSWSADPGAGAGAAR